MASDSWKLCSTCKKPIPFATTYYVCSVSTCTRKRTGLVFCSVECWESHVPLLRHRDAWAVEETSPTRQEWAREQGEGQVDEPRRIAVPTAARESNVPKEVLVIASRLKDYIRQRYGFNTSDAVLEVLSDYLRRQCDLAVLEARQDGRKTVMDRDFRFNERDP